MTYLIVLILNLNEHFLLKWYRKMCESINIVSALASRTEEVQLGIENS